MEFLNDLSNAAATSIRACTLSELLASTALTTLSGIAVTGDIVPAIS